MSRALADGGTIGTDQLVQSWAPLPGERFSSSDSDAVRFIQLATVRARSTLHAAVAGRPHGRLAYSIRHHRHGRMVVVSTIVEGPTP